MKILKCNRCLREQPETSFYKDSASPTKRQGTCILCSDAALVREATKIEKKVCNMCKQIKSVSAFSKNRTLASGLQHSCKKCNALSNKKRKTTKKSKNVSGTKKHKVINGIHMQLCTKCNKWLTLDNYHRNKRDFYKTQHYCKKCQTNYNNSNDNKKAVVYKIWFTSEPDIVYYGYTTKKRSRLTNHKSDLKANNHANKKLQEYYNKYGEKELNFEVIYNSTKLDCSKKEFEFIYKDTKCFNVINKQATLEELNQELDLIFNNNKLPRWEP